MLALLTMVLLHRSGLSGTKEETKVSSPRSYKELKADGYLNILAPYNLTLVDSLSPSSLPRLMAKLRESSGLEIRLHLEDNTQRALDMLQSGDVDLVLHSVAHTASVDSTHFVWLHELVADPIYIVQRADSLQITKQLDLNHKVITLPQSSPQRIFVEHLADEMGLELSISEDEYYNTEQLVMKVNAGTIDYTLCSGEEAKRYRKLFPSLNFDLPISHNLRRGWIARRSTPQLTDSLRVWLR